MKTCQETLEIYSAWIDGEATSSEAAEMQKHLDDCLDCRTAAEEFSGLQRDLREDTSDYLRVSSPVLAERVLLGPKPGGNWPSPRDLIQSKLLPTLAAGGWSALLLFHPSLLWLWPIWALVLFKLAQTRVMRTNFAQPGTSIGELLQPFGWSLIALTLLPTSALQVSLPEDGWIWLDSLQAGLGMAAATWAGALWGLWNRVSPNSCRRWHTVPFTATLVLMTLYAWKGPVFSLQAASLATVWLGMRLRWGREMADSDLADVNFRPSYPAMALLVDFAGILLLDKFGQFGWSSYVSDDFLPALGATHVGWSFMIPLAFGLWWVVVRTPLAILLELTHGRNLRWWLASTLGAVLTALAWGGFQPRDSREPWSSYIGVVLLGLVLGLVVASAASCPPDGLRKSILARRMRSWVLSLPFLCLGSVLIPELCNSLLERRWPEVAEPAQAALLRQQHPGSNPVDSGQAPTRRYLAEELKNGLDAEFEKNFSWHDQKQGKRTLAYLKDNLRHLDQALAEGGTPVESPHASDLETALWLRARVELREGRREAGYQHLLQALAWSGPGSQLYPFSSSARVQLCSVLEESRLSSAQYRSLWARLQGDGKVLEHLQSALDSEYRRLFQENQEKGQPDRLLHLPSGYYQAKTASAARAYLELRPQLKPPFQVIRPEFYALALEPNRMTDCESLLVMLGACIYRAEKGRLPTDLQQIETHMGRTFPDYHEGGKVQTSSNQYGLAVRSAGMVLKHVFEGKQP